MIESVTYRNYRSQNSGSNLTVRIRFQAKGWQPDNDSIAVRQPNEIFITKLQLQ